MKVVLLTLLFGAVCGAQETPAEIDPSKIPGEWRTIYAAADNKDKIVEGGPLRGYRHTECIDDCEHLSITFYDKDDGTCLLLKEVAKRKEGYAYVVEYAGANTLELIHVSDTMLVTYVENYDGEKTTKMTEGLGKGTSYTQEELQKYQELNSERGIPTENIDNVIETDTCPP